VRHDLGELFHYPEPEPTSFGRTISTAASGGRLWSAVQKRVKGRESVTVYCRDRDTVSCADLPHSGQAQQPCLTTDGDGRVVAVWNEATEDGWEIRSATLGSENHAVDESHVTHASRSLILPPTAAFLKGELWVAWAGMADGRLRIHVARHNGECWHTGIPFPDDDADAFRPSLASDGERLFLAWDQYGDKTSAIWTASFDGSEWTRAQAVPSGGERWQCPRAVAGAAGECYVTWVVLREVTDDLGIIDHSPFAMAARFSGNTLECLADDANGEDSRIIADFREGLLASESYMGYHGLRRNPQLALCDDGRLWCVWERREESEQNHLSGHLVGRYWHEGSGWSDTVRLHSGGFGYSVSDKSDGSTLTVSYFEFDADPEEIVRLESISLGGEDRVERAPDRWHRWHAVMVKPDPKPAKDVEIDGKTYHLFWADTHVHSVFSPDAEGEVDELIHFGRDVAGLDAMCVADNDYYPHKALSEAEWRVHQALSKHYTDPGEFVLFPGWEFTYHRHDLKPDFNHRIVFYPRPGGPLFRRIDPQMSSDAALMRALAGKRAVVYPHHPTYEILDAELERNAEICSSWRVVMEESHFTLRALQNGQRTGFIGSSDSHRAVPGLGGALTGIYAEELTQESLFEAYQARRLIATQGHFVAMELRVGDCFIGQEGQCEGAPRITARVDAPERIEWVQVIRDGKPIHRASPGGRTWSIEMKDRDVSAGTHFYFLRVKLVGDPSFNTPSSEGYDGPFQPASRYPHNLARAKGPFAWTSPVWVGIRE
jgi:hypothetical protein